MIDMKRLFILSLLCGVCVSSQAQYYLNVFQKNGSKVEYLISDLDSVTFTAGSNPVIPVDKKNVSKIHCTYLEHYSADARIESLDLTFNYDSRNRVTSITSDDDAIELDYSKSGSIIVTMPNDTATYTLDRNGYVNSVSGIGQNDVSFSFERDGDYTSKMQPYFNFIHNNGVLTSISSSLSGESSIEMTYRFNYDTPAINFDLNWFVLMEFGSCAPMWLGYCGKLSDKLLEYPTFSHSIHTGYEPISQKEGPEGIYHYEKKYNHFTDSLSNIVIVNDNDGYPEKITYSVVIEEYVYSYDYFVDIDTIYYDGPGTKGKEENYHIISHSQIIDGTQKDEPTGRIVGSNDIVYYFEYKE